MSVQDAMDSSGADGGFTPHQLRYEWEPADTTGSALGGFRTVLTCARCGQSHRARHQFLPKCQPARGPGEVRHDG